MTRSYSDKTRRQYIAALGSGAAAALAGCGGQQETTTNGGGPTQQEEITKITYRDRFSSLKQYAQAFNKSTDLPIKVNPSMKPPQSKYRGLIAQISAGNAPSVVGLDVIFLPKFAQLGALSDLSSFYNKIDYTDEFFEPVKQNFIRYNGTIYALPFWLDLSVYYYNKNHFEEVGLDPENPPTTWSEYRTAAKKLTTDDRKGLAATYKTSGQEMFTFYPFAWANGGKWFNEQKTKVMFDQQETVEALEFLVDIYNNGWMTDPIANGWSTIHNKFANGGASMLHSGGYGIGYIRDRNPDMLENIGTAPFPKPEGGSHSSFIGGNAIVIPSQIQQQPEKLQAAKKFIRWVNSDRGMKTTFDLGFFPARKSGFQLPIAKKQPNDRLFDAFQTALEVGHAPPMHPKILQMGAELRSAIQQAFLGKASAQQALTSAANTVNKSII